MTFPTKKLMQDGYKQLITYKLARIAFDLVWDFVPLYYWRMEDHRQRDQMKQAIRSHKQNIVEGSSDRSLSSKLTLYDVAQSSGKEIKEDCEDILRREGLPLWGKDDPRLRKLREAFEGPSGPSCPSTSLVLGVLGRKIEGNRGIRKEETEIVANYIVDILTRNGYLLDRQIRAVEEKHQTEGGYKENLLKKRLSFRRSLLSLVLLSSISLYFLLTPKPVKAVNSSIFTISAWVRPETSVANKAIVGKAEELRIFTDASGYLGCQIKATSWQTASQATTTALTLNTWAFVACTYDKITLRVYLNGVQVGSQALTATIDDTAAALKYGIDDSASTTYTPFKGTIDELKFYNYGRTASQISEDMLGGHPAVASAKGGTIAYYKFDEGYGTTTNNSGSAGNTINGSLSGTTWTNNAKFGKGVNISAITNNVNFGDVSWIDGLTGMTASMWINPTSLATTRTILSKYASDTLSNSFYIRTQNSLSDEAYFFIMSSLTDSGAHLFTTSNLDLSAGSWQHLIFVYDGTQAASDRVKIYKNGKPISGSITGTIPTSMTSGSTGNLKLGQSDYTTQNALLALYDEVKIYNYALTEDEVKTEYNRGSAVVLGTLSNTSLLTGGSIASTSASAQYCVPGDTANCNPPVGEWKFEEGTGTSANDTSSNGKTVTLGGGTAAYRPTWVSGKIGKALKYDAIDDYVLTSQLGTSPNTQTTEVWIKPSSSGGVVVSELNSASISSGYHYAQIIVNTNKTIQGWFYGVNAITIGTLSSWDTWNHIVLTYDGTTIKGYLNGVVSSSTNTGNRSPPATWYLAFGAREPTSPGNTAYFNGIIDEVKIYNYARTPAQIAWDYNRGKPVAHYKFDECSGITINDSSGNGNTGTLTNATPGTCSDGTGTTAWNLGATGKYNSSLKFDGADDYVGKTDFNASQINSGSMEGWFKANTSQKINARIIEIGSDLQRIGLFIDDPSKVLHLYGVKTTVLTDIATSFAVNDNVWHHFVGTWDSSGAFLYVDGKQVNSVTGDKTLTLGSSVNLYFGEYVGGGNYYYSGQMDDVKIYNYALTATQVKNEYNQGAGVRFGPTSGNP